jgi:hypothetical protein
MSDGLWSFVVDVFKSSFGTSSVSNEESESELVTTEKTKGKSENFQKI